MRVQIKTGYQWPRKDCERHASEYDSSKDIVMIHSGIQESKRRSQRDVKTWRHPLADTSIEASRTRTGNGCQQMMWRGILALDCTAPGSISSHIQSGLGKQLNFYQTYIQQQTQHRFEPVSAAIKEETREGFNASEAHLTSAAKRPWLSPNESDTVCRS